MVTKVTKVAGKIAGYCSRKNEGGTNPERSWKYNEVPTCRY